MKQPKCQMVAFTLRHIKDFLNASQVVNAHDERENLPKHGYWAYYLLSSEDNKTHLSNQEKALRAHYPEPLFIFKDAGSGLNEKRTGLWRLLEKAKQGEITDVAIAFLVLATIICLNYSKPMALKSIFYTNNMLKTITATFMAN